MGLYILLVTDCILGDKSEVKDESKTFSAEQLGR